MPSDTLELLDGIVKRTEAVGVRNPGQPLRAEDWNTLAEAVARLARLVATRERNEAETLARSFARADHAHLGSVNLTWFDAPTRALVEARGAAGDVAARLDGLTRETKALRSEVTALAGQVQRLRDTLTEATTEDLVRDRNLRRLGEQIEGVLDIDRRITGFDGRLATLDGNLREALAFRDTLRDDTGAPIDLNGLSARVAGLSEAQERLRLADGEIVRMRDFETRIAVLERGGVTEAMLDERIGTRLEVLVGPDSQVVTRVAEAVNGGLDARFADLEGELRGTRAEIETTRAAQAVDREALAALDGRLVETDQRLLTATRDLATLAPLPERMAAVETEARSASQALAGVAALTAEVVQLRDGVAGATALGPRVAALESGAQDQARRLATAESALTALPDLSARVVAAETAAARVDAVSGRLGTVEQQLGTFSTRLTAAESQLVMVQALGGRVGVLESHTAELASWRRGVDERLSATPDRRTVAELDSRLSTVERQNIDQQARIVATERSLADADLRITTLGNTRVGTGTVIANPVATPVLRPGG